MEDSQKQIIIAIHFFTLFWLHWDWPSNPAVGIFNNTHSEPSLLAKLLGYSMTDSVKEWECGSKGFICVQPWSSHIIHPCRIKAVLGVTRGKSSIKHTFLTAEIFEWRPGQLWDAAKSWLSQYFKFSFIYLKAGQIPLLRRPSGLWCCELINKGPFCFSSPDAQSEADPKGHNVLFFFCQCC